MQDSFEKRSMKVISRTTVCSQFNLPLFAADPDIRPLLQNIVLSRAKRDIISLAEAMPADKHDFVTTDGEFKCVRTFSEHMSHTATSIYRMSARLFGEECPVDEGEDQDGAEALKSVAGNEELLIGSS